MKKSLYLALTFCILFFAFSFSVNAVKNETFNTVDGEVVSIYSEEYEITVNIFGRPICMNTQGTLYNTLYGDIDKIDNIKVNSIDIDGNTAETVANFKNSELFEEFTSNNISFCYAPNEYGNNVMWRLLRDFGSDTNSVALPTTVYINSEGEILEVSSGVQGKEDILHVLNCENSFNEKVEFSVKGKANYDYAYEVLNLLNELRSSIGLPTLAMNKELLDVAMQRAAEISVYYSHTRPDGTNCTTAFPVQYGALAENIAMGQISPSEVMYDWTNSPGHFSNMTWNALNSVGIGVFEDADGNLYWVQFFYSGESDHYVKSGVEEKIFQITATLSNLNISCYLQGEKDQIYLEKGDKTNVIISNSESGSDFQVKSENEDLLYIDENGVATVKGETPFDVKLKVFYRDNPDVYFDVTLTIGHEHNYSSYSTVQNYKCGVEKKLYQYVCVLCEHTYEEEITTGNHKFSESDITTEPTCTTAGTKTYTCICGDTYTEAIPAINHANATTDPGKEPTTTEVGYTAGKYCPDCKTWLEGHEEIPKLEDVHTHSYTSTVTKEATCENEGEATYTCSCGDSFVEKIPVSDKHYVIDHRCKLCSAFILEEGESYRIEYTGLSNGLWYTESDVVALDDKASSYMYENGNFYYHLYVTLRGQKKGTGEVLVLDARGFILAKAKVVVTEHTHRYDEKEIEGTCIAEKEIVYTCTCGDSYSEKGDKNPLNHTGNQKTINQFVADCINEGYTGDIYCEDCNVLISKGVKEVALGHDFIQSTTVEPTCTVGGSTVYECSRCDEIKTESIPATNHANATTDEGKAPTTTEVGYTAGKYCPDCKTWIEGHEEIPMLHVHSYTPTITREPTCVILGLTTYTCSCGDSYTETMPVLSHEYYYKLEKSTLTKGGALHRICKNCNATKNVEIYPLVNGFILSDYEYTYNGKVKTPTVTVKDETGLILVENKDYTVKYESGRKNPGKYTVTVTLIGNYEGEKKLEFSILPGKTSKITATQSTSAIKLTWKKVTGATGYRVYQYNSKTGKYEKIKTLTGTSYTVKKLKAGTTYKFAVKAYSKADGETLWAASYKTFTTATKPATPTVKATAGSKQATISWNKVTGATGYVVYMQDEFGDYEKLGSTKKTSYTRKKLTKGKTYYFRVRAYKTVDGKNIYGGYKTVKVKVK